jgi:hypothetical protein
MKWISWLGLLLINFLVANLLNLSGVWEYVFYFGLWLLFWPIITTYFDNKH